MNDLLRFVWRGALGGMIVPLPLCTYIVIVPYGPLILLYLPGIVFWLAIPGAIVGATLWLLCYRFVDSLGILFRITIGAIIASTVLALSGIYLDYSSIVALEGFPEGIQDFSQLIFLLLLNGVSIGALAGWLCPSATVFRKEPRADLSGTRPPVRGGPGRTRVFGKHNWRPERRDELSVQFEG